MMQDPTRAGSHIIGVDPAGADGDRTVVHAAFPRVPDPEQLPGVSEDAEQQPNGGQLAADRINSSLPPPRRPSSELMRRWSRDPVAFARDIGITLDREESKILRRSMRGDMPRGRRKREILERVRVKIEGALQGIAAADAEGLLMQPQAVPEVNDGE